MVLNGKAVAKRMEKMAKTLSTVTGSYTNITINSTSYPDSESHSEYELWMGDPMSRLYNFSDLAEMQEFIERKMLMDTFQRLLDHYDDALRQDTWKGGGHPDDIPFIERNFKLAEENLVNYVRKLEEKAGGTR